MACCGQNKLWDVKNQCSIDINEKIEGTDRNFCSLDTGLDKSDLYRYQFCSSIGTGNKDSKDGEWETSSSMKSCTYNDLTDNTIFKCNSGTCCTNGGGTYCGITGQSITCKRKSFKANPLNCCLQDYSGCNKNNINACFEDSSQRYTCDPAYRNQSSPGCQDKLTQYCLGLGEYKINNSQEFINRWNGIVTYDGKQYTNLCYNSIYRNLFTPESTGCLNPPSNVGVVNSEGFKYSRDLVNLMIQKYIDDYNGNFLYGTESSEYNTQLNTMIWNICYNNPGLCQSSMFKYCSQVNTDLLQKNPNLSLWCGCYMSNEQYSKYTDLYGISRECTPTCNMSGVISISSTDGISKKTCKQSTCVIDDVSINIANSLVGINGGGVNFSQICNSCSVEGSNGTCNCTISNINITIIDSEIPNLNIKQQCSSSSICYSDENGYPIQVPCTEGDDIYNPYAEIDKQSEENKQNAIRLRNIKIIFLFFIIIILIIIIWYIFSPKIINNNTLN